MNYLSKILLAVSALGIASCEKSISKEDEDLTSSDGIVKSAASITMQCYWMENHSGNYNWILAPYTVKSKQECYELDSCNGGLGHSGGSCYKWAKSSNSPREPWKEEPISRVKREATNSLEFESGEDSKNDVCDDPEIMKTGFYSTFDNERGVGYSTICDRTYIADKNSTIKALNLKELFKTFDQVHVITSNGNWTGTIYLPEQMSAGKIFILTVNSNDPVIVKQNRETTIGTFKKGE